MATAQQLKALLQSYSEADSEMFVSVALQIAAHEARTGKGKFALEIKKLVDEIKGKQRSSSLGESVPITRPTGELATLLSATYPHTKLAEMVLAPEQRESLELVIREYCQQGKLREYGLSARRKLLLVGPPGVGKTMTSWALAGELKLPHFTVQLHSLITKYMGETAAKLFAVFEAMRHTRGVYLFDEFDAIGSMRAGSNDVGEIRRVLNSFLQFLEQDDSDSLIVAATNLEEILDEALFRRFDDVIRYQLPTEIELRDLIANRLAAFKIDNKELREMASQAQGLSHAEICRACDEAAKVAVLDDRRKIAREDVQRAIRLRQERKRSVR
ncbi:AAA ATPase central domain protein [Planctopirus limnophila DSM 3776]|uniref:AAA ATPase central domain protein n=1 Tax=Planctopirus limnophila (strain ATCC 43296 / DSM 3776 / IFAM 1008 / Mu 290) TaxID=521674 RepID=D5STS5_PLAL2|nr:ATP-binding protein [Planctopirus limnophila]ADG66910.1 AAA ATPase central domain protein [Planctopirus limnophila DSM 3776]